MRIFFLIVLLPFFVVAAGCQGNLQKDITNSDTLSPANPNVDDFRTRIAQPEISAKERSQGTSTPEAEPVLAIVNGAIIDGTGAAPIVGGTIIIQGDKIVAVGETSTVSIPNQATVVDVADFTVLPGIINSHVHFTFDPLTRHNFLLEGVTAVCDLGTSLRCLSNFDRDCTLENQPAARGFKAGPMITVPHGYPGTFRNYCWHYPVDTPAAARLAVEDLLEQGVDVIKISLEPGRPCQPWPVLTPAQVQIIADTAHARGKLVRAHVRQAAMLARALDAGVDVIEHTPLPFCMETELQMACQQGTLSLQCQPAFKAQLDRMAAQKVVLVPTLTPHTWAINELPGLTPAERTAAINFSLEIISYFRSAGGEVALGNDYGNPGANERMPLREMELLRQAGLTPMDVIVAGTKHAAYVSGHGHELGTLEPGKLADMIVVAGNPLADIEAMRNVVIVIKEGQIIYITNLAA